MPDTFRFGREYKIEIRKIHKHENKTQTPEENEKSNVD
jgi:hypothetical protein